MKRLLTFLGSLLILWFPFSVGCMLAAPISLAGLSAWALTGSGWAYAYTKNLLGGMDRACAGLLNLDAKFTISAHCGVGALPALRRFLDWVSPGHCAGAAANEGLTA